MKSLPVALQVYSVRELAEKDFPGTIQKIHEIGYEGVELAGFYHYSVSEIRQALANAGVVMMSDHVPIDRLVSKTEQIIDEHLELGCKYIAVPYLDEEQRPGAPGFDRVLKEMERIGYACRDKGITLLYHNHDFEFVEIDGRYGLDVIYDKLSADILQTEIDTCWVNVAGVNPWAYMRKYTGRSPVVHLKDFVFTGPRGVGARLNSDFDFRPVGHGMQEMPAILQASLDVGAEWVVVEQDRSSQRPGMDAARMSREYLKSMGW